MKVVNVYEQCYSADCVYNDLKRRAVRVMLQAESDQGSIAYRVNINFFPFNDAHDFTETYDAYFSREIYRSKGRRSRKREAGFMDEFRSICSELAAEAGGSIDWQKPLSDERRG